MTTKIDRRAVLLGGGAAALAAPALAQAPAAPAPAAPVVTPAALRADAAILRRAYETLHPGLKRYMDDAALARAWSALDAELARAEGLGPAFLAFGRFTSKVRCGHTFLNPANQGRLVREALLDAPRRLPFRFRWINGAMVVTEPAAPGLNRGDAVTAVDGVPASDLLARLMPLSRTDGGNDAKRIANLEVRGAERYAAFDVFLPLLQPVGDSVRLRLREPAGRARTLEAPALTLAQRRGGQPEDPPRDAERFTFALADGVGLLTMPTWALYNSTWDWRAWLNARIDDLIEARARGLIVDLRGNEGGQDVGDVIAARLINRDLPMPRYVSKVRYRRTPDDLNPVLDTWDDSFRDWGAAAVEPAVDGFYRLTREDERADIPLRPTGRRFTGAVIVLTDATNSSATFQFAQLAQGSGLARLVGRPTGGNRRGINGGAYFFLRMPNSRIEADLPLIGYFPETPQPDAGLRPDVAVPLTAADIAAGRDRDLERAQALIQA